MRFLIAICAALLLPTVSFGDTIAYTFSGYIGPDGIPGFPPNIWNGTGPAPNTFQMTFDVNTLSPLNSATYTFAPSPVGPAINSISVDLAATNFTLSIDGVTVEQSATADFSFSGTQLGGPSTSGGSFIGGEFSAGTPTGNFFGNPDFSLSAVTQAQLMASSDPLGLMLNGSSFGTDDFAALNYENSTLYGSVTGTGELVSVGVPEPGLFSLAALGALLLGFVNRRQVWHRLASQRSFRARNDLLTDGLRLRWS